MPTLLNLTEPATVFPLESASVNETLLGTTAWENVTVSGVSAGER